ncbi:MAG: hypothetical protein HY360_03980 [Verrucomicrobia bacterium]|nr:hypothetical protein [Verrucomicrobiota bacterium]
MSIPEMRQKVEVESKKGERIRVTLPPFANPDLSIVGVTFSWDMAKAYIAYEARGQSLSLPDFKLTPLSVQVNGADLSNSFRVMQPATKDRPGMLAATLPKVANQGEPFHVRLGFEKNATAQALIRASRGIFVDAFGVDEKDEKLRRELGLDLHPQARFIPADPACEDGINGLEHGRSAPAILATRRSWFEAKDPRLAYVHECQDALQAVSYRVYGQCADALACNPYRLATSFSEYPDDNDPHFIEQEENYFRWTLDAAKPRPWYWFPEAFSKTLINPELLT